MPVESARTLRVHPYRIVLTYSSNVTEISDLCTSIRNVSHLVHEYWRAATRRCCAHKLIDFAKRTSTNCFHNHIVLKFGTFGCRWTVICRVQKRVTEKSSVIDILIDKKSGFSALWCEQTHIVRHHHNDIGRVPHRIPNGWTQKIQHWYQWDFATNSRLTMFRFFDTTPPFVQLNHLRNLKDDTFNRKQLIFCHHCASLTSAWCENRYRDTNFGQTNMCFDQDT